MCYHQWCEAEDKQAWHTGDLGEEVVVCGTALVVKASTEGVTTMSGT